MSDGLLMRLKGSVVSGDGRAALELTKELLKMGEDPVKVADSVSEGLKEVGDLFEAQELFLPEVMRSANVAKTVLNLVVPIIQGKGSGTGKSEGRIAIGSLGPHDIGKTLVATMLISEGFQVEDLGTMLTPEKVLNSVHDIKILGLSVLLTSDVRRAGEIIKRAKAANPSLKVMVGGTAVNEKTAREIGAEAYGKDAKEAVKIARDLLGERG
ncbi:MAG: B12-binding domain-containing protein [Candidatus Verstraetearchaeota archaeon]|nr:B12-binding domain-containing protein [Candidatus Verstraetearchaeota archaeon]